MTDDRTQEFAPSKAPSRSKKGSRVRNTNTGRPLKDQPWQAIPAGAIAAGLISFTIGRSAMTPEFFAVAAIIGAIAAGRIAAEVQRRRLCAIAAAFIASMTIHPLAAMILGGFAGGQWLEPSERAGERRRRAAIRATWPAVAALSDIPDGTALKAANRSPLGWTLSVTTPRGIASTAVVKRGEQLASAVRRKLRIQTRSDNSLDIEVEEHNDPLRKVRHRPDKPYRTIRKGVEIGISERGKPVIVPIEAANGLVGGLPGGGKSVLLSLIIAAALEAKDAVVWAIDMKGGVELSVWHGALDREAIDMDQATIMLDELRAEMEKRQEALRLKHERKISPTAELPQIVLIVDELGEFDKHQLEQLRAIARLGRASGITIWAATQMLNATIIPTPLRALFRVAIGFQVQRKTDSDIVLGIGFRKDGVCATDLPGKGHCWVIQDGKPTRARTFLLTDEEILQIAKRNGPGTGPAQPGTGQRNGDLSGTERDGTPQVRSLPPAAYVADVETEPGRNEPVEPERATAPQRATRKAATTGPVIDTGRDGPTILQCLGNATQPMTAHELAAECGCSDRHAREVLSRFSDAGMLHRVGVAWKLRPFNQANIDRLNAVNADRKARRNGLEAANA